MNNIKIFFTYIPYEGCFQYKDKIKIYPSKTRIEEYIAHKPAILEFNLEEAEQQFFEKKQEGKVEYPVPKGVVQAKAADNMYHELLRVFSLLTNYRHFTYNHHQAWCKHTDSKEFNSSSIKWSQELVPAFLDINFDSDTSQISYQDTESYYGAFFLEHITPTIIYPENMEVLLDHYFSLPEVTKEVLDKSLRLFNQAIEIANKMPSLAIVAYISAIENLVTFQHQGEPQDLCGCGEIKYGVTKKFKTFVKEFIDAGSNTKKNKYVDTIYNIRSKIVHAGGLHVDDLDKNFWEKNKSENPFLLFEIQQVARISLINWLIRQPKNS